MMTNDGTYSCSLFLSLILETYLPQIIGTTHDFIHYTTTFIQSSKNFFTAMKKQANFAVTWPYTQGGKDT